MKIGHTRGYWQIKIDVSSKPCTAFSSPLGNLQFCHLTLGLASAPSTFTKLIRKLVNMLYLIQMTFLFSMRQTDEHINGIGSLLETIQKSALMIRPKKTFVVTKEVTYLGYVIKQGHINQNHHQLAKLWLSKNLTPKGRLGLYQDW